MSNDKNKTTNTFVIFRSVVLRSGTYSPHVPTPPIPGIQVALRPGCPPDYPPPLPRGTIVWAASDGSSTIDTSSGYYTVRPYAEVLAESRLSAVRTVRLYAHGQTSESFAANVHTGQKRGRSTVALACRKEAELSELRTPVRPRVLAMGPPREARKQRTLAYPCALSNQVKLRGRAFPPRAAVITAYRQLPCVESLEPDIAPTTEEDDRMFVPEDDMQGIMEEMSLGDIWTPPPEHITHDTEMKGRRSPPKNFSDPLRAFSVFDKPLNNASKTPLPRFMSRSAASEMGMEEDMRLCGYESGAQANLPQTDKSLESVKLTYGSPDPIVIPCPLQASRPPSLAGSWTECSLNKTTGPGGTRVAKHDTGRKERARRLQPYKVPKSGREKSKASTRMPATSRPEATGFFDAAPLHRAPVPSPPSGSALPPRTTFHVQEARGSTLSFAMAPAEDIATKLRERAEAFLGHLGNVLGAPRLPAFDVNAFFKQGNVGETHQEEMQPLQTVRSGSSLEELFQTMGVAEALPDPSEQQSPVPSPPLRTLCASPGTPTRPSRNEGSGTLVIDLSSDEEEDGYAGDTSRPDSLLNILGGVNHNLGFLRLQ